MNKVRTLFFPFIILCFSQFSCSKNGVGLPNGYILAPVDGKIAYLKNPAGVVILKNQVTQFCVSSNCVYGWQDNEEESFFYIDTLKNDLKVFDNWNSLDSFLISQGLPKLEMKNSYTYWDILNGSKKRTW